jgi:hypothetical protein
VNANLIYLLADAPLTRKERGQIYQLIDNETVHESITDAQRDEEGKTVLSSRVGWIVLAENGNQ